MTVEELIEEIKDARKIFVLHWGKIPYFVSMNSDTKLKFNKTEILDMEILIDDSLADDEFKLLRK